MARHPVPKGSKEKQPAANADGAGAAPSKAQQPCRMAEMGRKMGAARPVGHCQ
jgi:hypothetical protein